MSASVGVEIVGLVWGHSHTVIGDGVPRLVYLGTISDEGTLHHRRQVEPNSVIFYDRGHRCCVCVSS